MYVLTQTAEALDYEIEGEDEHLVARINAGERALFAQLYRRYYRRTFALAFGMTGGSQEADDVTQEIFMRAYERLDTYRGGSSFATWFYRLAVNHCLNYCRRQRRYRAGLVNVDDADGPASVNTAGAESHMAQHLLQRQVQAQVQQALLSLKPELRLLVVMKEMEGLSYEEIAERVGCSTGTVASRLSRARGLLARKLENLKGKI
jgi:RNA polymerase sigma-70 factor, ECF subfamily